MKQTEKKEVVNFIQTTLADGQAKTGTQLMELFAKHAELQEYNRKNLKQVFHRVSLSLADEGKIVVTRQPGTAPLLFSIPTDSAQQGQRQAAPEIPPSTQSGHARSEQEIFFSCRAASKDGPGDVGRFCFNEYGAFYRVTKNAAQTLPQCQNYHADSR
tara:strand:- start:899 stop:1372 length:474 start_codon:yes stop_codon:yes gene_type:complete